MAFPNSTKQFVIKIDKSASGYAVGPEYFNVPASPYQIYLDHVPMDSATTVIGASGGAAWTEVFVAPTATTQYLVDYTTGKLTFYSSNSGNAVQATYKNLGDDIMAEHLNTLQEEVKALEDELGSYPKFGYANVRARLDAITSTFTTKLDNASGIQGQWITDNTIRAGALRSDIKGGSWDVSHDVLTDITAHKNNTLTAHTAASITAVAPGTAGITTVQGHISELGTSVATPHNPHGLSIGDLSAGNVDYNVVFNNITAQYVGVSGSVYPSASGLRDVGSRAVPFASGNFDIVQAASYMTGISVGANGTFTSANSKTITVKNGLIVSIV